MLGNTLLVHAFLLFQMAASAPPGKSATPAASSVSPHGPMQVACENCHTSSAWKPIRSKPEFDHGKTGYPLARYACGSALPGMPRQSGVRGRGQQLPGLSCRPSSTKKRGTVRPCHRVNGWQVSIHSINEHQDRFPLIGAHAAVDCYSCHRAGAVGQFNRQGLSTDCVSCHLRAFQRAASPNHQALGYSTDCRQCHTSMDSWMVAAFPHVRARK